jgi:hypothetical protein
MLGAQVAVRTSDAERARAIAQSAGFLGGFGPDEPVEIPEEEWSHGNITSDEPAEVLEQSSRDSVQGIAHQAVPMVRVRPSWPWALALVALIAVALLLALFRS